MEVSFLLPVSSQVRYHKRINFFKKNNITTNILSFERDYYEGEKNSEYISLGKLDHGNYFKRILQILLAFPKIIKSIKNTDAIYVFEIDMLIIAYIINLIFIGRNFIIIYEIGDIQPIKMKKTLLGKIVRGIEKYLVKRVDKMIVTSKDYMFGYYKDILNLNINEINYQVIENKIDKNNVKKENSLINNNNPDKITIGYFGVLRCERSWEILKNIALLGNDSFEIYVRGYIMKPDSIKTDSKKYNNIKFEGPYTAPSELSEIYNSVDIIWACFPYRNKDIGNWKWARTNRFYESCYFNKPMIVQKGTQDSKVVEENDLGISLDLSNIDESTYKVINIDNDDLKNWRNKLVKFPEKNYIYQDEHELLCNEIKSMIK